MPFEERFNGITMPGANVALIALRSIWMIIGWRPATQFSRMNPAQPL